MEVVVESAFMGVDGKEVQRETVMFNLAGYQNVCALEPYGRQQNAAFLRRIHQLRNTTGGTASQFLSQTSQCSSSLR
jgi:hypothetical protein